VITGGSDNLINLVDIWGGFKHFGTMKATSPVHCLETIHNLTIAGTEDGNILAYDNDTFECLYGYNVLKIKIKCLVLELWKLEQSDVFKSLKIKQGFFFN